MDGLRTGFPALVIAACGVGVYYLATDVDWQAAAAACVVPIAVGWVCLAIGRRRLHGHPVSGARLMAWWMLAVIGLGAAVGAGMLWVGIQIPDWVGDAKKPSEEEKAIAGALAGALTTFAATAFTKDLEEGTGDFWPAAKTKAAFGKAFENEFDANSLKHEAAFQDRMHGADVNGWDYSARLARARIIAKP